MSKYTPAYGKTRHKELLERVSDNNRHIAGIASDLRQHANPSAMNLLMDIVLKAADSERAGFELINIINNTD